MANVNALQQMIFPDENAPIHRKKSVTAASVKTKGSVLGQKKPVGGARKALNDITNKSGAQPKASSKNKKIAASASASVSVAVAAKGEINIAGERFLHDHSKCIKEQQNLWDDHLSADLILLHHDPSISEKHLKHDKEMMDAKNNLICKPEEIPSPKLTDWLKSSTTPWRSPLRHGSMTMMPSTPLAWRFDSAEFTLKEDYEDLF
uniref:Protein PATRONUS 2 n=1 Tax=Noccaea caerulescens TaxID=107243 RepID=A0A1J3DGG0_NOCCA